MTTENDKKTEDLLRKIRALRAKAESPGTTEAESLAFAAKAAEMLAAHGLEESQLAVDEQSGVTHERHVGEWNNSPARRLLVAAICRLYGVKPIINARKSAPWVLIGRKHSLILVREMATYLIDTTKRLSNEWKRQNPGGNHIDFRRGCFQRLSERLNELRKQQEQAAAPIWTSSGNPGNLPALFTQENRLVTEYMEANFRTRKISMGAGRVGDAGQAGRAAGDRVSLSQQLGSRSGGGLLIGRG